MDEIGERIRNFNFKSSKMPVDTWHGSSIVEGVLEEEKQRRFKTVEEQLIYRINLWIDNCRFETTVHTSQTESYGQFCSVKRSKSCESISVPSMEIGLTRTICPDIRNNGRQCKSFGEKSISNMKTTLQKKMRLTRSTTDLSKYLGDVTTEICLVETSTNLSMGSSASSHSVGDAHKTTSLKPESKSKQKFSLNIFRKKTNEKAAKEYRSTPKPSRKKDTKDVGENTNRGKKKKSETVKVKPQLESFTDNLGTAVKVRKRPSVFQIISTNKKSPDINKLSATIRLVNPEIHLTRKKNVRKDSWTIPPYCTNMVYIKDSEHYI